MNRSILATVLVVTMVVLTVMVVSVDRTDADTGEDQGYEIDLSGYSSGSGVEIGGLNYIVIKDADTGDYKNFTPYYTRIIIDCETVGSNVFEGVKATTVVFTSNVKTICSDAFLNATYIRSVEFLGESSVTIEEGAFKGCTNLGFIDLRSYGSIADGAFPGDCAASVAVYEGDANPGVSTGVTVTAPRDSNIVLLRYTYIQEYINCFYVGGGLLASAYDDGSEGTQYSSPETVTGGTAYRFILPSTGTMAIRYVEVEVSYGGAFGFEDETLVMDASEVALKTPSATAVESGFEWRTASGVSVGTSLSADEVTSLGTKISLVAWTNEFTVTFDAGDLPETETAALPGDMTCTYASVYPDCGDTEHYEFVGWTVDGETILYAGDTVASYEDHTATAVWSVKSDSVYTVTYLNVDGTAALVSEGHAHGTAFEIGSVVPDGETETRMLDGWTVGDGDVLREGDSIVITGDVELTPVLRDRGTATLTYVSHGVTVYTQTVYEPYATTVEAPDQESVSELFDGWSMDGVDGLLRNGDAVTASSDATLEASWTAKTSYTVKYVSGGETVSESIVYADNASISVHADVSKDYHTLTGWSDGSATYADGAPYAVAGDVTFTAVWTEDSYTVRYVSDGATIDQTSSVGGADISVGASASKAYHTLSGWSDGSATYAAGSSYTVTGDVTFTAVWTQDEYTITYVSDGETVDTTTSVGGVDITVGTGVSKTYWTLKGWSDGDDVYAAGAEYSVTGNVTFEAVWTQNVYTVRYVSDGATIDQTSSVGGADISVGADVSKNYYTLAGWNDGSADYEAGTAYTVTGDVTFTAVWTQDEYTITYVSDGETVDTTTSVGGARMTVGTEVSKTYYTLAGWSDGTSTHSDGSSYTVTGNVTFTAVWTQDEYIVKYVSDGATIHQTSSVGGAEIEVGREVSKTYWTLEGWSDGSKTYDAGSEYTVTGDVTFTAVWSQDEYTVKYVSDGETVDETTSVGGVRIAVGADVAKDYGTLVGWTDGENTYAAGSSYTVTGDVTFEAVWTENEYTISYVSDGETVLETTSLGGAGITVHADVTKTYHTLSGWSDGETVYTDGSTYTVTGNVTFTAVWTAIGYTVEYVSDGETVLETTSAGGVRISVGAEVSKDYCTLVGWTDGKNTYAAGSGYTVTGDVTFTAVWTANTYTVTFLSDGSAVYQTTGTGGSEMTVHTLVTKAYHTLSGWSDGETVYTDGAAYTITGDVTFEAVWTQNVYTVKYVSEGETVLETTSAGGVDITVHAEPEKAYHTLSGWSAGSDTIADGSAYTITGDVTFEAVWTADSYTVKYVSDDGTVLETTSTGGMDITVHASPVKAYHTLSGWSTGGTTYADGSTYTVTGDVTFTAVWTADSYTVKYISEGETVLETTSAGGVRISVGAEASNDYHVLSGWSDGSAVYAEGSTYTVTGDVTFTAVWDASVYTVRYVSEGVTVSETASYGGVQIEVGAEASKTYWTLEGWNDGSTTYDAGSGYTVTDDVTFTAVWSQNVYKVSYISDGVSVSETTATGGEIITVGAEASKAYHTLSGWSTDGTAYTAGTGYTVTGDVTFTAVWSEDVYTIRYVSDGVTVKKTTSTGGTAIQVGTNVSKTYFTLDGWNDGSATYDAGTAYTVIGDVTFTAVWSEDSYSIVFVSDGETVGTVAAAGGETVTLGANVSKEHHVLAGWTNDGTLYSDGYAYTVTGDATFTAVWSESSYTVRYVSDGETVDEYEAAGGTEIEIGAEATKDHHVLAGWNDGSATYDAGTAYTVIGDVTFTAVWTANEYTVRYVSDGETVSETVSLGGVAIAVHADVDSDYRTLAGWSDGSGTYADGAPYIVTGDVTFTAVWTDDSYTIRFVSDGLIVDEIQATGGAVIVAHADVSDAHRTLAGWSDGTSTYEDGADYAVTGDATLTAVWTDNAYAIRFVSDDATVDESESLGGVRITVHADVAKAYHTLAGWSDGTSVYADGAPYTVAGDTTFTAVWTENVYTIVFVSDGMTVDEVQSPGGVGIAAHSDATKAYHTLTGWSDGTNTYADGSEYTVTGDATLTAVWTTDGYTVAFVSDGETVHRTTAAGGDRVSVYAEVSKDFATLTGWSDGMSVYANGSAYTVTGDVTFTAVWTESSYTVRYVSDGLIVDEIQAAGGSSVTVHADATKAHHTLTGWSDGTDTYADGSEYTVSGDATLTAVWTENVYTIVFVSDGETVRTVEAEAGDVITLEAEVSEDGRALSGWTMNGTLYSDGCRYTVTGSATFSAVWTSEEYTVTYVSDGAIVSTSQSPGGVRIAVHADTEKADHTLTGWSDGSTVYADGSEYTVSGDVTFTAVWAEEPEAVSDGGSSGSGGLGTAVGAGIVAATVIALVGTMAAVGRRS